MNDTWDLSALYEGFDDPAFQRDYETLGEKMTEFRRTIRDIQSSGAALNAARLASILEQEEQMWILGADLQKFSFMRQAANAGDTRAADEIGRLQKRFASVSAEVSLLRRWMAELTLTDEDRAARPILKDYTFYIEEERKLGRHTLGDEAEGALSALGACAGEAWTSLRDYVTSFAQAELDGKPYTLTQLRGMAQSADASVRKAAFEAELRCSKEIAPSICFALNNIKAQVITLSELRGYDNVMQLVMEQDRMQLETLDALWAAVRGALPALQAYLRRKAELLGYKNGLPWYELHAPFGAYRRTFTLEQTRQFLERHLGAFAEDLGALVSRAFDERWIDFYPRVGKSGGAFCRNLSNQRQSRVLTNFTGDFNSVVTIAHELGHAYHGQQIELHRPLNRIYTMPVAETASNFNETIIKNAAIREASEEERLSLIEQQLQGYVQTICDIYSRYLFEKSVFEARRSSFIFPDRLCEMMHAAQLEAFGDALDPEWMHPYMWVNKVHYYYSDLSFYNFPYTFGALLAAGLYAQYQKEGAPFVEKYRTLLRETTVNSVEGALQSAGIDVTKRTFWDGCLSGITAKAELFLEKTAK